MTFVGTAMAPLPSSGQPWPALASPGEPSSVVAQCRRVVAPSTQSPNERRRTGVVEFEGAIAHLTILQRASMERAPEQRNAAWQSKTMANAPGPDVASHDGKPLGASAPQSLLRAMPRKPRVVGTATGRR